MRGSLAETNDEAAERLLSSSQGMNQAEAAFGAVAARPLPFTVEGMVERQLFDALCGYSTGERDVFDLDEEEGGSGRRPRRKVELKVSALQRSGPRTARRIVCMIACRAWSLYSSSICVHHHVLSHVM